MDKDNLSCFHDPLTSRRQELRGNLESIRIAPFCSYWKKNSRTCQVQEQLFYASLLAGPSYLVLLSLWSLEPTDSKRQTTKTLKKVSVDKRHSFAFGSYLWTFPIFSD